MKTNKFRRFQLLLQVTSSERSLDTQSQNESKDKEVNLKDNLNKHYLKSIQEKRTIDEDDQFGDGQDSLRHMIAIKQKEIDSIKLRCSELEEEKGHSILELTQTPVMSSEPLEKLSNLETKQDLLEIENTETMNRLI